ncbi:MAG: sulfatase-like hydrolase/transferase [Planctomycetes bacterium]|nr:sulfatase-like hydrolase/transferase [Planctomycetota bacterium]
MSTRPRSCLVVFALSGVAALPTFGCGNSEDPSARSGRTTASTGVGAGSAPSLPEWQKPLGSGELRNILLVTLDGVRADHLVTYGSLSASSPRLDHLAATGVLFAQAISPSPSSLPAHASILTGLYPFRHGLRTDRAHRLTDSATTLAQQLTEEGFETAAVVSSAYHADAGAGLDRGFTSFDRDLVAGSHLVGAEQRSTDATDVTRRARAWLERPREEKPFFLWVHYSDAVQPYAPPPGYAKRAAGNPYDGEIAYVDEQVGALLDLLRARSELADTLVVVAGAHGESLGEHDADGHDLQLYDATIRVPMIFSHPNLMQGMIVSSVVSTVDVAPTVLELMGQVVNEELDGAALGAVLTGQAMLPDRLVYSESRTPYEELGWADLRAVRSTDVKYIRTLRPEIYGLNQDPNELYDFSAEAADQMSQLAAQLDELLANGEVDERRIDAPSSVQVDANTRPDPKDAVLAYTERRRVLSGARGLVEGMEGQVRSLLEGSPNAAELNSALGTILLGQRKYAEALEPLRVAAEADDAGMVDYLALAKVTKFLAMPEAEKHLMTAREVAPRDPSPDLLAADWARAEKDLVRAREFYAKALELEPSNLLALIGLGAASREAGFLPEAREALERGLAINPRVYALQFELGKVSQDQLQFAQAAVHYEMAAQLAPRRRMPWRLAGSAMLRIGRQEDALRCLKRAAALGDRSIATQVNLGALLFQKRDYAGSMPHFDIAVEVEPSNAQTWLLRGVALDQLGRIDEAKQSLAQARVIDAAQVAGMAAARDDIMSFLQRNP